MVNYLIKNANDFFFQTMNYFKIQKDQKQNRLQKKFGEMKVNFGVNAFFMFIRMSINVFVAHLIFKY